MLLKNFRKSALWLLFCLAGLAFNVLGSYNYTYNIVRRYMEEFDAMMPVGFRCLQNEYRFDEEENQQYLLLGLVAIIILYRL